MILIMGISFYTTRVVLEFLGIEDYGIYNVIGGMVSMFALFSNALTSAISRFLTFELAKKDPNTLKETFSAAITILVIIAIASVLLIEPAGIWFINNKMRISPERLTASHWVFQCSILTFAVNLISIPYNALIIAHERMQAFAYISLLEAALKLGVAFIISVQIFDSLKLYAVLIALVALVIRFVYGRYASIHFKETHAGLNFNRTKFKQILSFTGWTCIGGSASILNNQGVNVLLNVFWGTVVNAARGVASQVNAAVVSFSGNFMMAVNPQIIKSYASGDTARTEFLVFKSSRMAFYLMLLISMPILVETKNILSLWLKDYPDYTIIFVNLVLCQSLIEVIGQPLQTLNQAYGKVKTYQIVAGGVLMLNFPLSYLMLKFGFNPDIVYYIAIFISLAGLIARLALLQRQVGLKFIKFFFSVFIRGCITASACYFVSRVATDNMPDSFLFLCIKIAVTLLTTSILILFIGLDRTERSVIKDKILSYTSSKATKS